MKYARKYSVDLDEIHAKHLNGYSLPELAKEYGIPRTTLNRYLRENDYPVYFNRHKGRLARVKRGRRNITEFACPTAWRNALIEERGHKCQICGYSKIVDCHHIVFQSDGGKHTRENGILLCPNHHAEVHAGFISKEDLLEINKKVEVVQAPISIERRCDLETR